MNYDEALQRQRRKAVLGDEPWMASLQYEGDRKSDPWLRHAARLQSRPPLPAGHEAQIIKFGKC